MRLPLLLLLMVGALALPVSAAASVRLINVTSPVHRGSYATVSVQTFVRGTCSIRVHYGSKAPVPGLTPKGTLFGGIVQWQWRVSRTASRGRWSIDISCGTNGSLHTSFLVV
jgi:hypothetical protein